MTKRIVGALFVLALASGSHSQLFAAATIGAGDNAGAAGTTVTIPVTYVRPAGDPFNVYSTSFRISHNNPPITFVGFTSGSAPTAASVSCGANGTNTQTNCSVFTNPPTPIAVGSYVLGTITYQIAPGAASGEQPLLTAIIECTDANGDVIPGACGAADGSISVGGASSQGPSLSYSPAAGSAPGSGGPVEFSGVSGPGATGFATIVATPAGGSGGATTTLSGFSLSGSNAGDFSLTSNGTLTFTAGFSAPQNITLTCTAGTSARSAILQASENISGGASSQRYWSLNCPGGSASSPATISAGNGSGASGTTVTVPVTFTRPADGPSNLYSASFQIAHNNPPISFVGFAQGSPPTAASVTCNGNGPNTQTNCALTTNPPTPIAAGSYLLGTITYQIAAGAAQGEQPLVTTVIECTDASGTPLPGVCAPDNGGISVGSAAQGPSLSYSPAAGSSAGGAGPVAFSGGGSPGTTGFATIVATPTGGSGGGTTTLSGFSLSGSNPGDFSLTSNGTLTFTAGFSAPQNITLTCTTGTSARSAILQASENISGGAVSQRYWALSCPGGAVQAPAVIGVGNNSAAAGATVTIPVTFSRPADGPANIYSASFRIQHNNPPVTFLSFTSGSPPFAAMVSCGANSGNDQTNCALTTNPPTPIAAGSYLLGTLTYRIAAGTPPGQQSLVAAVIECTNAGGDPIPDACTTADGSISVGSASQGPSLAYSPAAGTSAGNAGPVGFSGVSAPGSTGQATIVVTPSGGSGGGSTTLSGFSLSGSNAGDFSLTTNSTLSFTAGFVAAQNLSLTCTAGASARSAILQASENIGGGATTQRYWLLNCPAGAAQSAATIGAGNGSGVPGGTVSIPLTYVRAPGDSANVYSASFQIASNNPPIAFTSFEPGSPPTAASVTCSPNGFNSVTTCALITNPPTPIAVGSYLLGTITYQIAAGAAPGEQPLVTTIFECTDINGTPIAGACSPVNGRVSLSTAAQGPSLAYNPPAGAAAGSGGPVTFSGAGAAGTTGSGVIAVTPSGGSGAGTTTLSAFALSGPDAAHFSLTNAPTLSFAAGIATSQNITLACTAGELVRTASLQATENRSGVGSAARHWALVCPAGTGTPPQSVAPPSIESQTESGNLPDAGSLQPALSADGLKLVFASDARNLTSDDTNGRRDVFLRDRAAGTLTRLSALAEPLNGGVPESFEDPALSSDGRTAVFVGSSGQVYLTQNGVGRRINVSTGGEPGNGPAANPVVRGPGPGDKVYFDSEASNLVGFDGNAEMGDVYVVEIATRNIQRLSLGANGEPANGPSRGPDASDDGSVVAFSTRASNIVPGPAPPAAEQIVVLAGGGGSQNKSYVSRNVNSGQAGNANSRNVSITRDGRWMVFESDATNLVAGDTNGVTDVFRAERVNGVVTRVERVSVSRNGVQGNGPSTEPEVSEDGQTVTFTTQATNLFPGDTNGVPDVVIKRMDSGDLSAVVADSGALPNGESGDPTLSADGRTLAFGSSATNMVIGDTNGVRDIFSSSLIAAGPQDEPAAGRIILPVPNPPNANCPSGFFIASVVDGPGSGLTRGLFGMEVVLDQPGTRLLAGGLNFGGLIDTGQVGFAGFNFTNPNNEPQRVTLELTGSPITSSTAALPVRITIIRQTTAGNQTVFETSRSITLATPYVASVDLTPGFYVATVAATTGSVGGAAEGQFYFGMSTSFIGRPGGGFQGGAVVGGYHAEHPFGGVSGFAGFCIGTPHTSSVRVFSRPTYGVTGARDLRLSLQDAQRRNVIVVPVN